MGQLNQPAECWYSGHNSCSRSHTCHSPFHDPRRVSLTESRPKSLISDHTILSRPWHFDRREPQAYANDKKLKAMPPDRPVGAHHIISPSEVRHCAQLDWPKLEIAAHQDSLQHIPDQVPAANHSQISLSPVQTLKKDNRANAFAANRHSTGGARDALS